MATPRVRPDDSAAFDVGSGAASDRGAPLIDELIQLGIALSSEGELYALLGRVVTQARRFTGAEAATLFLREGAHLRFAVVQNDVMARRLGEDEMRHRLDAERLPLDGPSLASHVALTGAVVNVPDAYSIPPGQPCVADWLSTTTTVWEIDCRRR